MSEKFAFLSDEWISKVEALVAAQPDAGGSASNVLINLVVTETPFGADREFHMGSADGKNLMGGGHRDGADVTLTTDYVTAKDVFVAGNPQVGMQAFMAGKVKVQGDMSKLMMSQGGGGNTEMQAAIEAMTE